MIHQGRQRALLPGIGRQYEVIDDVALFAGVHQGFSPAAPGQGEGIRPEQSVNWEAGVRAGREDADSHGQLAFFYSDYQNLTGDCTGAGGCGTAAPRSAPVLISEGLSNGRYQWQVELPIVVTYQAGSQNRADNLLLTLLIVRVPKLESPNGVGIEQWVAQPM